jgi:hypothetical protein
MKASIWVLLVCFGLGGQVAAQAVGSSAASLARSAQQVRPASATAASAPRTAATTLMIASRSRELGDQVSGSGTRYFYVGDRDVRAGSSAAAVRELIAGPVVTAADHVRRVEVAVEFRRPVTIIADPGENVQVGTVNVDADVRRLQVRTHIYAPSILIDGRRR